jgi:hypothetical protein
MTSTVKQRTGYHGQFGRLYSAGLFCNLSEPIVRRVGICTAGWQDPAKDKELTVSPNVETNATEFDTLGRKMAKAS